MHDGAESAGHGPSGRGTAPPLRTTGRHSEAGTIRPAAGPSSPARQFDNPKQTREDSTTNVTPKRNGARACGRADVGGTTTLRCPKLDGPSTSVGTDDNTRAR